MALSSDPVCIEDFRNFARTYLPKSVFDYYSSGASEQQTLEENIEAFKRLRLRPRLLRDVSHLDTSFSLLGKSVHFPIGISPTAMQKMAHADGEVATAKAAAGEGMCMVLSTYSTTGIEEVSAAAPNSLKWFQLYILKDRERTKKLVKKVENNGFSALVATVDTAVFTNRRDDDRNKFAPPSHLTFPNFEEFDSLATEMNSRYKAYLAVNDLIDTNFTWSDVRWLCSITKLPVVLKGILTAEDAELAVEYGALGIIVSNHGGRVLDGVPATIEVLPEIVKAVDGRVEVYLDGGIRQGTDVLKALALGANAVFIGRPVLWGLAYGGEDGVRKVLQILQHELKTAMALSGCKDISEIRSSPSLVKRVCYLPKL